MGKEWFTSCSISGCNGGECDTLCRSCDDIIHEHAPHKTLKTICETKDGAAWCRGRRTFMYETLLQAGLIRRLFPFLIKIKLNFRISSYDYSDMDPISRQW